MAMFDSSLKAVTTAKSWGTAKLSWLGLAVLIGAICIPWLAFHEPLLGALGSLYRTYMVPTSTGECGDDLTSLLTGHWEQQPMTEREQLNIQAFMKFNQEKVLGLPRGLERRDKLCGNVSIELANLRHPDSHLVFRALCDARGPTPCCFRNVCRSMTVQECACADCLDPRTLIHAEHAVWRPADPGCRPLAFSPRELCDLLDGGTIYFVGDSLVRHVHAAMLMTIRNDFWTGAFSDTIPAELRERCRGLYMFTVIVCLYYVAENASACENRVQIRYVDVNFNDEGSEVTTVVEELKNKSRSLVFVGFGRYDSFNSQETFTEGLKPALELMSGEQRRWPVVVWSSMHSFGMQLNPTVPRQSGETVLRFNRDMQERLAPYANATPVYVFDTFDLTTNVASFDGQHFATGINKAKVNLLMNFIWGLKRKNKW